MDECFCGRDGRRFGGDELSRARAVVCMLGNTFSRDGNMLKTTVGVINL